MFPKRRERERERRRRREEGVTSPLGRFPGAPRAASGTF